MSGGSTLAAAVDSLWVELEQAGLFFSANALRNTRSGWKDGTYSRADMVGAMKRARRHLEAYREKTS